MGKIADAIREGVSLPVQKKQQMLALDGEFVELEAKVKRLETELLHLKAKVNPLEREVERLQNQVKEKSSTVHQLQSPEIDLMKFIGDKRSATLSDIQEGLGMHSVEAEHRLGHLLKGGYIEQERVPMVGAMYSLSDLGNAYLVENKLIPLLGGAATVQRPNNPQGHHCDHCGSTQLRRTGSKPDPMFGELGVKMALYSCIACGKESGFTDDK